MLNGSSNAQQVINIRKEAQKLTDTTPANNVTEKWDNVIPAPL